VATIKDFLEELTSDKPAGRNLADRFEETPVGVMVEKGLTKEDRDLIMNGPIADIRKRIESELADAGDPVYVIRVKRG
jgi:hypothetical protein